MSADHRTLHLLDAGVIAWVVLWCVLGVWTGLTLWDAADVGETITTSGESIASVGQGLEDLSAVPVVGDRPAEIGKDVSTAAADITVRGGEVRGQLRQLAVLLGVSIIGIPVTPIAGVYLPLRVRRARDVRRIRAMLAERGDDPRLDQWLADRARASLPFHVLVQLETDDRPLADAELARLGLARPSPAAGG